MGRRTGNQRAIANAKEASGYEKEKKRKKLDEEDKQQGEALLKLFKKIKERPASEEGTFL